MRSRPPSPLCACSACFWQNEEGGGERRTEEGDSLGVKVGGRDFSNLALSTLLGFHRELVWVLFLHIYPLYYFVISFPLFSSKSVIQRLFFFSSLRKRPDGRWVSNERPDESAINYYTGGKNNLSTFSREGACWGKGLFYKCSSTFYNIILCLMKLVN
jgi:hypothetical protein